MPNLLHAIAVAYSGGLDSSVLLHLAHGYASIHGITLFAFHIHHGISLHADDWLKHCRRECEQRDIAFDARYVNLGKQNKGGLEEAARVCRYAALGELCRIHHIPLLLTAHHQDDQAETVLLQLLRGCGVAGLSGMNDINIAPDLLGDKDLLMARPLLNVSREALAEFIMDKKITYIEDESNADPHYARNALRHQVMPSLAHYFPGFQSRLVRTAQHAQAAQRLLNELAAQDLVFCKDGKTLDIHRMKQLGTDRIDNLLRHWFNSRNLRIPSTAWLHEMRTQLLEAKEDAQLCVTHADCHVRRYRDRIFLTSKTDRTFTVSPLEFHWRGESSLHFPSYGGRLHFEETDKGINTNWLREQPLLIHYRRGGESLKPAQNRHTKTLKHHYQVMGIPPWEREYLPLVSTRGHLLFAAGVGMDCYFFENDSGIRVRFWWEHEFSET